MADMKLILAVALCAGLILQLVDAARIRKSDTPDFLDVARKGQDDNGPCTVGRCDTEEESEGFEERNLRIHSDKQTDSSSSDSAMMPQEILLPPTPPEGTTK